MQTNYKVFKVENNQMIEVPLAQIEKEIIEDKMGSLYHDIQLVRDKATEILVEHFGEGKIVPSTSLSDECKKLMLSKSSFTLVEIKDQLMKNFLGVYKESSIKNTPYSSIKVLLAEEKVKQVGDGNKYINMTVEEKEDASDDSLDDASMPSGDD